MPRESFAAGWAYRAMAALAIFFGLSPIFCLGEEPNPAAKVSEADRAGFEFFETKIRPVLAEHCYKCHGSERHKANLRLDSLRGMLTGGESGPAIVPGDAEHSLLVQVIGYSDDYVQMPPTQKLPEKLIANLTRWVKLGAPWPGADKSDSAPPPRAPVEITDKDRAYWFYQPIRRPAPAQIELRSWPRGPIDALVLARLEAKKLEPNDQAGKRTLIRRAYFDLIGLPPTPEEVAAFVKDDSPTAYEKVIDGLLARPQYGERWARHWLDVVRFAQTNGYERDGEKPNAWRYRDYVIKSFNEDKPYDRFVVEQLAGDDVDDVSDDSLIATGFYRLGIFDDEPDDARMAEFDGLDDIVVTTGAAFMGLTMGCCRCHDHKFDPLPQADYYRLLSFFRNIRHYENPNNTEASPTAVPLANPEMAKRWFADRKAQAKPLEERLKQTTDKKEKKRLEREIKGLLEGGSPPFAWALGVKESGSKAPPTHVLIRGNAGTPGAEVQPAFLSVLGSQKPDLRHPPAGNRSTGRRLALARWLTSRDNPLTSRVMVNRIWQHHFGQAIVRSTNDFGRAGIPPTNPELLDWLAAEFIESGWSIKHMHKLIMLSATYRMSSEADNAQALAVDPGNELLWRQNLRRVEAEAIRDTILFVSGDLNPAMGGRGFFPRLGGEVLAGASKPGAGWEISPDREQDRRSIYTFVKRSMLAPALDIFDYSNTAQPLGERPVTTVAPQSLMLLNDDFMQQQAAVFAERLVKEAGGDSQAQIRRAYSLAFNRAPSERESRLALDYLQRQASAYALLRSRLTFRPDVPFSLEDAFLRGLGPTDFMTGPRQGWSYYRGRWQGGYQGIKTVDPQRGPFALWQGAAFRDGVLQGRLMLHNASELGSLIFRATAEGDVFRGYEVVLNPREQSLALERHGADVTLLAEVDTRIATGEFLPIKIEVAGPRIRVWLGVAEKNAAAPTIDITDPQPLGDSGLVGVRTWGAALSLDPMTIQAGGRRYDLSQPPAEPVAVETSRPLVGWQYFGGQWSAAPDNGYGVRPQPGAKIVWQEPDFSDGVVEAEFMLRSAGGDAGLVLRVNQPTEGVDALTAYNINFKPNSLRLGKHANNWRQVAGAPLKLELNRWHPLRVQLDGGRVRIWVDGAREPLIDYVDDSPLPAGKVGLRTFNADFALRNLQVKSRGKHWKADFRAFVPDERSAAHASQASTQFDPRQRALESLCLLILNLNELIYVD